MRRQSTHHLLVLTWRPWFVQVLESDKALKHMHSGSRAHSGSGLGRDEVAQQENGAQDLIRRSLPEGTTFSRSNSVPPASLLHLRAQLETLGASGSDADPYPSVQPYVSAAVPLAAPF